MLAQVVVARDAGVAARALGEFARVCDADGRLLWGKPLCGPLVLVDPLTRRAVADRPDPDGKFRREGEIFSGTFPEQFTPSNTAIKWGGQEWATVMLPLPADPFRRLSLLAHESFHRIQPGLGLRAADSGNAHLETEAGRIWLRLELRALARALRAEKAEEGRSAAEDAMLFRLYRHKLCPGSESTETALERQEGLAEYTGVFVALRATGESVSRVARVVEGFEDNNAFARTFAYATGPALGLLLDRYATRWRGRAASASLGSLLSAALHMQTPSDLPRQAQLHASQYGFRAVSSAERERAEAHRVFLGELRSKFLDGPTLALPSDAGMSRNFDPGKLVPFPPHGTYYAAGTFTASWGKLTVESGGALVAPDNTSVQVPGPTDMRARPVRGAGWILDLKAGWTVTSSGRPGSFVVVRER